MNHASQFPLISGEPATARSPDEAMSPERPKASRTLGTWLMLCTPLLMFGGLFCVYGAYRVNYPRVFAYAHPFIDKKFGVIITVMMTAGSVTMAWGMRSVQLGRRAGLIVGLILTLLLGIGSARVKVVEYRQQRQHHLWIGEANRYHKDYAGDPGADEPKDPAEAAVAGEDAEVRRQGPAEIDPLAGTADEPKIKPSFSSAVGLMPPGGAIAPAGRRVAYKDLDTLERGHISSFFSLCFLMTGLHGLCVLVCLGLILGALAQALVGRPCEVLSGQVTFVGLLFQVVTLIWFFIFPLVYLIH